MAKDNVIGLAMELDVTDLKAGIQEVNKLVKKSKDEFNNSVAGLEKWQKTSEGLTAKLKQLDGQLSAQKKAVAGYEAEIKRVSEQEGDHSAELEKLKGKLLQAQTAVKKTEGSINYYEKSLADVTKEEKKTTSELGKLTNKISEQKDELSDLSDEYSEAVLKYGKNSTQAKRLKKDIDILTTSLNKNKRTLKDVSRTAVELEDDFSDLDKTSSEIDFSGIGNIAAAGIGAAAGAVGGLVTAFFATAESTRELRTNMSKLKTSFESAGFTAEDATETYKELYSVVGDEGKATEAAAFISKLAQDQKGLAKWTDICTGVYAEFGDSLPIESLTEAANETVKTGKITGALADALNWAGVNEDLFQESLDKCTTEQERNALITETLTSLYGGSAKAFRESNKDIIDGNKATAELSLAMADLGAIAEPILTELKTLSTEFLNELMPLVKLLGEGFAGALNGSAGASDQFSTAIGGIIELIVNKMMNLLPTVLEIIVNLVPSIIQTILNQVPNILQMLLEVGNQIILALTEMMPGLLETVATLLPQIVTTIIGFVPTLLESAISLFMTLVNAIPVIIPILLESLPMIIDTIINAAVEAIPRLTEASITFLSAMVDAIPTIVESLGKALPDIINAVVDGIISYYPVLLQGGIDFLMALIDAIPTIISELAKSLPDIITKILNTITDALPELYETAKKLYGKIVEAVPTILANLRTAIDEIITSMVGFFTDGASDMMSAGGDLVKGLWEGITGMTDWVIDKISGFTDSVLGGIKNFFGIHSPSTETALIGKYLDEGLAKGIDDNTDTVVESADEMGESVIGAIEDSTVKKETLADIGKEVSENLAKGLVDNSVMGKIKSALDKIDDYFDKWKTGVGKYISQIGNYFSDIMRKGMEFSNALVSYQDQLYENEKNALDAELEEFTNTKEKEMSSQEEAIQLQLDNLKMQKEQGVIISEEYNAEKEKLERQLSEFNSQRQKEIEDREIETAKKKNEIAKKQFESQKKTDIATAVINGAQAILKGFAELGPIGGAINAAVQAGITAAQIATIAAQRYVPAFAKGGVVSSPTLALVGEAGKEAVMPLENNTGWITELAEKLSAVMNRDYFVNPAGYDTMTTDSRYGSRSVVNNFTQVINAPKSPSRRELYRDTKNLLALKGV